jgi:hypothetical protein
MANSIIGALRVMLGMDTAEFEDGANSAQRRANRFGNDMQKLGGNLQKIGVGMTAGLTAPLTAFGVSAFKAASDAAELQSAFNQTFGDLSDTMNQWAEETGDALGRSTQSMQQLATTFGIFFNQAAPTRKEAAEMSKTFAVLAQDLASFYNLSEDDALAKLRSGLAGESEPLRDFGVFLTEASVASKALELGLAATTDEITEQDKILARYNLILEGTKNAQGDVARTSEGTANQMRAASAAFDELQVIVGTKLLPVITPLIAGLADAIKWFSDLPAPVQNFALGLGAVVAILGPVIAGIGTVISAVGSFVAAIGGVPIVMSALGLAFNTLLLSPLGLVVLAIGAVVAAWYYWDEIVAVVENVGAAVSGWWTENIQPTFNALGTLLVDAVTWWVDLQLGALRALADLTRGAREWLVDRMREVFAGLMERLRIVQLFLSGDFAGAWTALQQLAVNTVRGIAAGIESLFPGLIKLGRDIIAGIINGIRAAPGAVRDALLSVVQSGVDTVKDFLGIRSPSLLFFEVGSNIIQGLANGIEQGQGVVGEALAGLADQTEVQTVRIADTVGQMAQTISGHFRSLVDGVKSGNFFDIFDALLGIGTTLGGAGVFGKGVQSFLSRTPGFANGGAMRLGGIGGVDRNVLSLNGSPIARVSAGETMQINPANDRGGGALRVVVTLDESTGALGAFVRNEAGQVVAQAAPSIAAAGAGQAVGRIRQMQGRALA